MVKAILVEFFVMLVTVLMDRSFGGDDFVKKVVDEESGKEYKKFNWAGFDDPETWTRAIGYGFAAGVLMFLNTLTWWWPAVIALVGAMGLMIQYAWWWGFAKPVTFKSLVWFLIAECLLGVVARSAAAAIVAALAAGGTNILTRITEVVPTAVSALCSWSAIVGLCRRKEKKVLATVFKWLAILIVGLSLLNVFVGSNMNLSAAKTQVVNPVAEPDTGLIVTPTETPAPATPNPTATPAPATPTPTVAPTNQQTWWTFYNLTIQNDGLLNDNDFGPNPCRADWWTREYANDMLARIRVDPVLGAADIAYFDHVAGTAISGVKYDKDPEKWLANINARALDFVRDQELYKRVVDEFIRTLNNSSIVQSADVKPYDNVKYLMYMDPNNVVDIGGYGYGYSGSNRIKMPKVIMKPHNEQAWFLVFVVKNGSSTKEAIYKLACGYQPPIEKTGNGGINPGGNNNSGPDTPTGQKPKNPNKGTESSNDTGGPGGNTNNGVGAQTSTADTPTNSTSMTYDEYKEEMGNMPTNQQAGGGPNTPSTATPPGANVDNNADRGTGNGGIDTPTTVTGLAVDAGTGQPITTNPAGAWGGPSD